jgi:RsiW-degrading membrane proteinase PrsW (M82 family)
MAAICFMSVPMIFNAFTIADIISIATDTSLPENSLLVKIIIVILALLILFCSYQYFGTKKRIKVIFDEFEHISKNKKITLGILSFIIGIAYAVGSIMVSLHFTDIIKCRDLGICS